MKGNRADMQDKTLEEQRVATNSLTQWWRWQIFKLAVRFNWNYTTTYEGRVWGNHKTHDWTKDRIHLSGDTDFSPFAGGGYTEVSGMVNNNPEAKNG